jgi:ribosomal protein S18 acetylase RimI-like enzyme
VLEADLRGAAFAGAGLPPQLLEQLVAGQVAAVRADRAGRHPDAERLIALDGGAPAGAALLDRDGADLRIVDLGVVASARRRGIGRALLTAVLERAGGRDVVLTVARDNAPARALYAAAGFAEEGGDELTLWLRRVARPATG